MQIRPHVHSYDLEWEYDEPLSVHVIETDDATVLFGGGTDDTAAEIAEIAEKHGVDVLVVEHGDLDHFGGVPAITDALDLEVAVPADDASFLEDAGIGVDHHLEAGETYWGIETISTPGHTPDNMCYLYENVLVAGDTVVGADSLFAADGDWSGAFAVIVPEYNADDELTRRSVSTLLEYEFDCVLLSHGENVPESGRAEIETLVGELE